MKVLERIFAEIEKETNLAHEEMRRCSTENPLQFDDAKGYARGMSTALENIRSHMKDDEWIPVEERLPEAEGRYLAVFGNDNTVHLLGYGSCQSDIFGKKKGFGWYDLSSGNYFAANAVKAWRPLPEPYQPKEELQRIKMAIATPKKEMTLDEAIAHAREVAEKKYIEGMLCHANPDDGELDGCIKCAKEHEQLQEWLTELRQYRATGLTPRMAEELKDNDKKSHKLDVQYATELDKYHAIGTLEECRGYKIHSKNIRRLNSCNDCGRRRDCKMIPRTGEFCRINCFYWEGERK